MSISLESMFHMQPKGFEYEITDTFAKLYTYYNNLRV